MKSEKAIYLPLEDWNRLLNFLIELEMDAKIACMVLRPEGDLSERERKQMLVMSEFIEKLGAQFKTYVEGYHETTGQDRQGY